MIFKSLFIFILLIKVLFAEEFTVASFNVENLFDLKNDGTEYKEYVPNTTSLWNKKTHDIKLNNISKVIRSLDADIIVLQEIESLSALLSLKKRTKYKYHAFSKQKKSSIGLAVLSNYKILKQHTLKVKSRKIKRDIQEVDIQIQNKRIKIFNNHWPSKRQKESFRILYANTLNNYIKKFQEDLDYILLGDFNSNYNEKETLKLNKDLNDSYNITGINDILLSSNKIHKKNPYHYNLWYELEYTERFSAMYRNNKITPDNILLPQALFDQKNISYINNSFKVLKKPYLITKKKIHRWKMIKKYTVHAGEGYSDHLAIIASFDTEPYKQIKKVTQTKGIAALYKNNATNIKIKNAVVIYKNKNNYIIKQKNNRAIYIYNSKEKLELSSSYNLYILKTKEHYGLKEISSFRIIKKHPKKENIIEYFTQAKSINLFDMKYQNELIINLKGHYKKGYLYYVKKNNTYKIRLYSKDKTLLPKNGQKINIIQAHLSFFKNKAQIIINKKSEYYAY